jgi:hypothetical protein
MQGATLYLRGRGRRVGLARTDAQTGHLPHLKHCINPHLYDVWHVAWSLDW